MGPTYLMHVEVQDDDLLELVEALQEGGGHRQVVDNGESDIGIETP